MFTLRPNLKEMEEELENFGTEEGLQRKQTEVVDLNNPTPPKKPSVAKKKVRQWARSKILFHEFVFRESQSYELRI